jgi:hypothetical protein
MNRPLFSILEQRRDGLLREAEHIEKRLKAIHEEVTALNTQIVARIPGHQSSEE